MLRRLLMAAAVLCACAAPAAAQSSPPPPVTGAGGSQIAPPDPNTAAFYGEVALTVGTPDSAARRSLKAVCTAAGAITVTYYDGSTGTWSVAAGVQTFPIAITTVALGSPAPTCVFTNLK